MRFRSSFLLVVMLSACTQLDEEPLHSSIDNRNNQSGTLNNNPCSIALTALDHNQSSQNISRYQHAILRNHQALANLEKLGWAFVEKARTSFDPGFYKLAEQTVACLIQKQPENVNALMLKSHILHNLHRFKDAELVARQVVAQRGSWFEYAVLGDALMEQGKLDQAALAYQHMVDQRPGPQSYSRAAHLRWLFGDLDGAIELMALAVQAHVVSGSESTAWFQTRLAMYLFQAGQFDPAEKILTTTLARHSTYAPALLVLGRIHLAQENHAQAVKIFTIAETINPLPEYQWLLIEALLNNGQTELAHAVELRLKRTAITEDKRTYALYLASVAGDAALAQQLAKAELDVRQDVLTKDALAWSLFAAQQVPEALMSIKQALSTGTRDARLFYHAAMITRAAGQNQQSLHWYQQALLLQHMLYPSERENLFSTFVKNQPHVTTVSTE